MPTPVAAVSHTTCEEMSAVQGMPRRGDRPARGGCGVPQELAGTLSRAARWGAPVSRAINRTGTSQALDRLAACRAAGRYRYGAARRGHAGCGSAQWSDGSTCSSPRLGRRARAASPRGTPRMEDRPAPTPPEAGTRSCIDAGSCTVTVDRWIAPPTAVPERSMPVAVHSLLNVPRSTSIVQVRSWTCTRSSVVAQWRVPGLDTTALLPSQVPWHSSIEYGLLVTALLDQTPTKREEDACQVHKSVRPPRISRCHAASTRC
jgi:hypothetical protein